MRGVVVLIGMILVLSGCTTVELAAHYAKKMNLKTEGDQQSSGAVPQPRYKVGNPYEIDGIWYYPERDLSYDETGIASWYGDEFAGKPTANGEIFDPDIVSAAHKTLPMPSVVRVINLDNGRSLVVRINDRGPFVAGRIIDLCGRRHGFLVFRSRVLQKCVFRYLQKKACVWNVQQRMVNFHYCHQRRRQAKLQCSCCAECFAHFKGSKRGCDRPQ